MVKVCCIEKDQDEALSSTSPSQLESNEGSEGLDADDIVPATSAPHPGHSSASYRDNCALIFKLQQMTHQNHLHAVLVMFEMKLKLHF